MSEVSVPSQQGIADARDDASNPGSEVCALDHQAFRRVGPVAFRRDATDGTPVMVMSLGERNAALPLRSLQRELSIADDSPDGRMLGLIAQALDFVPQLGLGDRLPQEVLTGEAHWSPAPHHQWLASSRLQIGLLSWLSQDKLSTGMVSLSTGPVDPATFQQTMQKLITDPDLRQAVHEAFEQAADMLGLPGAAQAVALVEQLAKELSYIEALRESLLGRVQALVRLLARAQSARLIDRRLAGQQRGNTLHRVAFLATSALAQFARRFDTIDAQTGEVLPMLRNAPQHIIFIRQQRDALFIDAQGWQSTLSAWEETPSFQDPAFWDRLSQTYHVLARSHMPLTQWRSSTPGPNPARASGLAKMAW